MRALTIDAEFKALIPPLAPDERQLLEESILAEGCRDAIVVWHGHGIILDGHNRYDICTAHNIPFQVVERAFDTRADAKVWVLRNQLGRRNLPEPARVKLALLLKPALAEQARERQAAAAAQTNALLGRDTDETLVPHVAQASIGRTRDKLAEEAGISKSKFSHAEYVLTKAPAFISAAYEAQDIAARPAYELAKRLEEAPEDVRVFAERYRVLSADKVDWLIQLHKSAPDTFAEFLLSGCIQPGEEHEAVSAEAPLRAWQTALALKAKCHKQIARDEKQACLQDDAAHRPVPHVSHNSGENEWYTPADYTAVARAVMGAVDLDPASSDAANLLVQAARYYTVDDDGLTKDWSGRVWMNPPYSQPLIAQFCAKLVRSVLDGHVTQACVLVNNATETAWFQSLLDVAAAVCFIRGRVKFLNAQMFPNGAPLQGQALLYIGPRVDAFKSAAAPLGKVLYV